MRRIEDAYQIIRPWYREVLTRDVREVHQGRGFHNPESYHLKAKAVISQFAIMKAAVSE